jgi:hypothetical protein
MVRNLLFHLTKVSFEVIPLLINLISFLLYIGALIYVGTRSVFNANGQHLLIFVYEHTSTFIYFVILNSCIAFFTQKGKRLRIGTFALGVLLVFFALYFYSDFNPY